jgi:uncharacterized protein YjbI with pentapeptide repeats
MTQSNSRLCVLSAGTGVLSIADMIGTNDSNTNDIDNGTTITGIAGNGANVVNCKLAVCGIDIVGSIIDGAKRERISDSVCGVATTDTTGANGDNDSALVPGVAATGVRTLGANRDNDNVAVPGTINRGVNTTGAKLDKTKSSFAGAHTRGVETTGASPVSESVLTGTVISLGVNTLGASPVNASAFVGGVHKRGVDTTGANVDNANALVPGVISRSVDTTGANLVSVNASVGGVLNRGVNTLGANFVSVNAFVGGVTTLGVNTLGANLVSVNASVGGLLSLFNVTLAVGTLPESTNASTPGVAVCGFASSSAMNMPAVSPLTASVGLLVSPVDVLMRNSPRPMTADAAFCERMIVTAVKLVLTVICVVLFASLARPRKYNRSLLLSAEKEDDPKPLAASTAMV